MKRRVRWILLALWGITICMLIYAHFYFEMSISDYPNLAQRWFQETGVLGLLLFVALYIIRPLLLIPPTIPCTVAGVLFGPTIGILLTIVGENLSSWLAYVVGRYFAADFFLRLDQSNSRLSGILNHMKENDFLSVFLMRMLYLPYDPVSCLCGATQIPFKSYVLGTFVGTLPGVAAFVFLGTSFTDPKFLTLTLASLILGYIAAKWMKKYRDQIHG